jgi:hypothetical protein
LPNLAPGGFAEYTCTKTGDCWRQQTTVHRQLFDVNGGSPTDDVTSSMLHSSVRMPRDITMKWRVMTAK